MNKNKSHRSLKNTNVIQTYDIRKLFYVAFMGGVIPTVILGTINARWLKIDKKMVNLLIGLGLITLITEVVMFGLLYLQYLHMDKISLIWLYRIISLLLYLAYFAVMKEKFNKRILFRGKTNPLFKDALLWTFVGVVLEFLLFYGSGKIYY